MGTAARFDLFPLVEQSDAHERSDDVEAVALDPCFRGSPIEDQAASLGVLDAATIGRAVLAGAEDPQNLKKVWHHVARFGSSIEG